MKPLQRRSMDKQKVLFVAQKIIKPCDVFLNCFFFTFQGVPLNSLRFLFDGQRINDEQTPKDVSIRKMTFCTVLGVCVDVL